MGLDNNFELLDDYLANRLSAEDKASFEQQLNADPALKQDFIMQQKLVEGIRNARMAELKTMLNNTPIPAAPPAGMEAILSKLSIAAVVAGLVGVSIYLFVENGDTDMANPADSIESIIEKEPAISVTPGTSTSGHTSEEATTEVSGKKEQDSQPKTVQSAPAGAPQPDAQGTQLKKPDVFDPTAESDENTAAAPATTPTATAPAKVSNGSSIIIEAITDSKYDFHYQFRNGKLLLYGPFAQKNMYEILEFFAESKRTTVVLFYKDGYYLLDEATTKVTPLKSIADPALLKKLKESRGN